MVHDLNNAGSLALAISCWVPRGRQPAQSANGLSPGSQILGTSLTDLAKRQRVGYHRASHGADRVKWTHIVIGLRWRVRSNVLTELGPRSSLTTTTIAARRAPR